MGIRRPSARPIWSEGQKLPEPKEEEDGEVVDLMAALRESVERTQKQKKPTRKRAKKAS